MTVTLTKEAETYVTEVMQTWSTGQPEEVVSWLILKQRADEWLRLEPELAGLRLIPVDEPFAGSSFSTGSLRTKCSSSA